MQTTGHLIINGQKVLVLVRAEKYGRALKIRKSGQDGNRFEDEEFYFLEYPNRLQELMDGKVIHV